MAKKYANFFIARLSSDISASDIEIPINDLPKDDNGDVITAGKLVIDAKRPDKREVIAYTGLDGAKLTGVSRGLARTLATPHQRNATVEMTVLGSDLTEVYEVAELYNNADKSIALRKINGGTTAGVLTTDASGSVNSRVYPKAAAWRSSSLTVNGFTKLVHNTVEYNIGDCFNSTTGVFTASITGQYDVSLAHQMTTSGGEECFVSIYKNGAEFKRGNRVKYATPNNTVILATTIALNAGDTLEFYAWAASAVASASQQTTNYMTVGLRP